MATSKLPFPPSFSFPMNQVIHFSHSACFPASFLLLSSPLLLPPPHSYEQGLWCQTDWPHISSVQSLSRVWLFVTPRTAAHQASLSITNSQSLPKLMSTESVMPSNHLILCLPLLLPPSVFPSIEVFSSEPVFRIQWPKYWSFSFSINPSNQAPLFTGCVTLGFVPRFHHLSSGMHSSICLVELLWGLNEVIILKAPRIMPGIL